MSKATQFKPGQSGNPSGPPKAERGVVMGAAPAGDVMTAEFNPLADIFALIDGH